VQGYHDIGMVGLSAAELGRNLYVSSYLAAALAVTGGPHSSLADDDACGSSQIRLQQIYSIICI
jgi:hypothetical protein